MKACLPPLLALINGLAQVKFYSSVEKLIAIKSGFFKYNFFFHSYFLYLSSFGCAVHRSKLDFRVCKLMVCLCFQPMHGEEFARLFTACLATIM